MPRRLRTRQRRARLLASTAVLLVALAGTTEAAHGGDVAQFGKPGRIPGGVQAWFAGSTPDLTTVVRAGVHEGGAPLSGAVLPSQLWHSYMEQAADPAGLGFPH